MTEHTKEPWIVAKDGATAHTKEPWVYEFGEIGSMARGHIARMARDNSLTSPTMRDANARRIVACVNACAGVDTDALTPGLLVELLELGKAALAKKRRANP